MSALSMLLDAGVAGDMLDAALVASPGGAAADASWLPPPDGRCTYQLAPAGRRTWGRTPLLRDAPRSTCRSGSNAAPCWRLAATACFCAAVGRWGSSEELQRSWPGREQPKRPLNPLWSSIDDVAWNVRSRGASLLEVACYGCSGLLFSA